MTDIVVPISDHDAREYYGVTAEVIARTGLQPADLGLDDASAFNDFVETLLRQLTEMADREMRKTYLPDDVPAGLDYVVDGLAADALREMVATRQTPVLRIDDFAVTVIQSRLLTPAAQKALRLYAAGGGARSIGVQGDLR